MWRKMAKYTAEDAFPFAPEMHLEPRPHFHVGMETHLAPQLHLHFPRKCIFAPRSHFHFGPNCIWRPKRIAIFGAKVHVARKWPVCRPGRICIWGMEMHMTQKWPNIPRRMHFHVGPKCIWRENGKSFKTQLIQRSVRCMSTRAGSRKLETAAATRNSFQTR